MVLLPHLQISLQPMTPEELRAFRNAGCKPLLEPVDCDVDVLKAQFMESKCTDTFLLVREAIKKRRDDSLVIQIVDSDHLALVVGEYMLKYDIPAEFMLNFPKHVPYIFLTYTTVHNIFLSHFEPTFVDFAGFGILKVLLDSCLDQERLKNAILRCTDRVEGLEESIWKYERFREKDFLQKVSHMISPEYSDLMLSIHGILSEYNFCLDSVQAYSLLKSALGDSRCRPDFVQYLASKLDPGHVAEYRGIEETLIVLHSKYRTLLTHVVPVLSNSIEKHYLLTCGDCAFCPNNCIPLLHSCTCETICSHIQSDSCPLGRINGFYFSLHDRNYAVSLIEEFLSQEAPNSSVQCMLFREQVLCFMRYASEKQVLDMYFSKILRFKDKELTHSALVMLSGDSFFRRLLEVEELLPMQVKKMEAGLMHIYRLLLSRYMHGAQEMCSPLENSMCDTGHTYGFYMSTFIDYVIYKDSVVVLLQVETFDVAEHHHKLDSNVLEKYIESRDVDSAFIETHFERYKEIILKATFKKTQIIQNYQVVMPCFRGVLRDLAFKCVVREELYRIAKSPKVAAKVALSEREAFIVFEYLRSYGELKEGSRRKKEFRDALSRLVEKYSVLPAESCAGTCLSMSNAENTCNALHVCSEKNMDAEGTAYRQKLTESIHKHTVKIKGDKANTHSAVLQYNMNAFATALESGIVTDRVMEEIAAGIMKHKHEIAFLVCSMITKNRQLELMASAFSALLDRLEPSTTTFYIRIILSHSRESMFVKRSMRLIELLLCKLTVIDTEAARLFIRANRHAKSFEFLEHIFQKINYADTMKCMQTLRCKMKVDMIPHICGGISACASMHLEKEERVFFLKGITADLAKDNNELMRTIGLRLLVQNLLSVSSIPTAKSNLHDPSNTCEFPTYSEGAFSLKELLDIASEVPELLNSNNDFVVTEALDVLKVAAAFSSSLNSKVFDLLYRRAKLDKIGRRCIDVLDIGALERTQLDKLFQMFYLDPPSFLEVVPKLKAFGYEPTREMVEELVFLLAKTFSDEKRMMIYKVLIDSVDSTYIDVILNAVSANNPNSQLILVSLLERVASRVDMKMFLRLCTVIPTDKRLAVKVLRLLENKTREWSVPEKWMVEKLDMLMVWIYPLQMKDRCYYEQLCARVKAKDPDVCVAVKEYYARECK